MPEKARRLYLDIATMHQFAVPVRAGTISRVSGIHFRDYEQEFLEPLKDMVTVVKDAYGDYALELAPERTLPADPTAFARLFFNAFITSTS